MTALDTPPITTPPINKLTSNNAKLYLIYGQVSRVPIYWEAELEDGRYFAQVDHKGDPTGTLSSFDPSDVSYIGLTSSQGRWGFFPKQGRALINGASFTLGQHGITSDGSDVIPLRLSSPFRFRCRHLVDSSGTQELMLAELSTAEYTLTIRFWPNFDAVLSATVRADDMPQETTPKIIKQGMSHAASEKIVNYGD